MEISIEDNSYNSSELNTSFPSYKNINETVDMGSKSIKFLDTMNIEEALIKAGGYGNIIYKLHYYR